MTPRLKKSEIKKRIALIKKLDEMGVTRKMIAENVGISDRALRLFIQENFPELAKENMRRIK